MDEPTWVQLTGGVNEPGTTWVNPAHVVSVYDLPNDAGCELRTVDGAAFRFHGNAEDVIAELTGDDEG